MATLHVLTEENYKECLEKMIKMCKKYKVFEHYECFHVDHRTKKENYSISNKTYDCANYEYNKLIIPEEHVFKQKHDNDPESFDGKEWNNLKPLIRIGLGLCCAICLTYGDKVRFERYGFIVYTDDPYTRFENDKLSVYKHTFVYDKQHKITDYETEIEAYVKAEEQEADWCNNQYEIEMEREFMLEEDDNDDY